MADVAPPSTGKKKKARQVFGNILSNGDVNHSLSYTPSPYRNANDHQKENPPSAQSSSGSGCGGGKRVAEELFPIVESTTASRDGESSIHSGSRRKSENSCSQKSSCRSETSTVVVKPFANILGDDDDDDDDHDGDTCTTVKNNNRSTEEVDKENMIHSRNKKVPNSIRVFSGNNSFDSKLSVESTNKKTSSSSKHSKPPSGRSLPRTTFTFDRNSGRGSVNQALNAAKLARERAIQQKAKAAAAIRDEWKEEKEEALDFYEESEKMRREQLNLQQQLSSQFSKAKAKRNQQRRQVKREEIDNEAIFKSTVAREHQQKLKEIEDERRRQSIAVRANIRANNRQGEEQLKLMTIEEEKAIFETRHKFSVAQQQYKQDRLDSARKNFQFRRGDALRIRDLHNQMEGQRKQENHENVELMLAGARDTDEYKRKLAEQRRQSLAFRNAEAREQRQREAEEQSSQKEAEHESFELKRASELDVVNYKKQLEDQRRASLAFRNEEGRKHRETIAKQKENELTSEQQSYKLKFEAEKDAEAYAREQARLRRKSLEQRNTAARELRARESQQESERLEREHAAWELKVASEKDVEEYERQQQELRRMSFQQRNALARQQREDEKKRQDQELELDHESYELKWGGERDAEAYLRNLDEERRKSLNARNMEARNRRLISEQQRTSTLQTEHESYELKRAAAKDVEEYQKNMEQERRDSLAFRNKERVHHANVMEELNSLAREAEAESYTLKWAGENDAKEYLAQLEAERRQSLQLRNEEGRRHRQIENEMRNQELIQAHEDEELKAAGHQDVESYKRERAERDRASLEFRGKETIIRRLEEQNRLELEREKEARNFELETQARQDMENYLKKCKNQRRRSLAHRAKDRRRHAEWVRAEEERQIQEQTKTARLRARDSRSMELARQRERTEQAMVALRHANCTFSSFPTSH